MERATDRVASVISVRPARLRRPAMTLGPDRVLTLDLSSWDSVSRTGQYLRRDLQQVRSGSQPNAYAAIRNVVTGAFRCAGYANIAHARRLHPPRRPAHPRPLRILLTRMPCGRLGDIFDHLDELVAPIAVAPGELHKFAGAGNSGGPLSNVDGQVIGI